MSKAVEVEVDGRRLKLSNLQKIFYPETGFTKGQVVDYYTRIAPAVLPHLRGRPLTMKRYPDGVEGGFFYEKQRPKHAPEWIRTFAVPAAKRTIDYVIADDLPTLVWLANMADLELHTSLSKVPKLDSPTTVAFDLDPGEPAGLIECSRVARAAARPDRAARPRVLPEDLRARRASRSTCRSTAASATSRRGRSPWRSRGCWSSGTPSWSSRR